MSERAETILDFKDYVPPKLDDIDTEYRTYILEDISGQKFKFKHRVPTTSEVLSFRKISEDIEVIDNKVFTKTNFVKGFNFINKTENDFNCLPGGLNVNHLTETSIREVVNGFCKRV